MNIKYFTDAQGFASHGAELIASFMQEAVQSRSQFLIALSGGSTPRAVYERLTRSPYGDSLPWNETSIYFGDERMVPSDNEESNYRMACESLLDHVAVPPWNLHRIHGEDNPSEAARLCNDELKRLTTQSDSELPRFDLILLGLGPDGHTASLFPETDVLTNVDDMAAEVELPSDSEGVEHAQARVTMTYPVLNAARHIVFLVSGEDKSDALRRVQDGDETAPATRVCPQDGTVQWLVVRPA